MRNANRILVVNLIVIAVAGCALFGSSKDRAMRNSPSFKEGYEDGCAAANQEGADLRDRLVQDPTLYKTDGVYRAGWSNGFQSCRRTNTPAGTEPGTNPLPVPVPGGH